MSTFKVPMTGVAILDRKANCIIFDYQGRRRAIPKRAFYDAKVYDMIAYDLAPNDSSGFVKIEFDIRKSDYGYLITRYSYRPNGLINVRVDQALTAKLAKSVYEMVSQSDYSGPELD